MPPRPRRRGPLVATDARLDSLASVEAPDADTAARLVLKRLEAEGFLLARIDSAHADTLFATRGPEATVETLDVIGAVVLGARDATTGWATRLGTPYRPATLADDMTRTLERYATRGFVGTRLTPRVRLEASGGVRMTVEVAEGTPGVLAGVELSGSRRASRAFASRVAGVAPGDDLARLDPRGGPP